MRQGSSRSATLRSTRGSRRRAPSTRLTWSRYDNAAGSPVGASTESRTTEPRATAPPAVLEGAGLLTLAIESVHPDYPKWREPVRVYFRRAPSGWQTIGLERAPE